MKKYDVIAFDLDGTLTDPERGLISGFEYTFDSFGLPYRDKAELKHFIGPPLLEEWQRYFGISRERAEAAVHLFRDYYSVYGWWDNEIYAGIPEALAELKARGKTLILATSKPEHFAKKNLALFEMDRYFDFIGGAASDIMRDKKHEVLDYALESVGIHDRASCILVGDRKYDVEGARICGVDSMGVLWGHGARAELEAAGADMIVATVAEMLDILK